MSIPKIAHETPDRIEISSRERFIGFVTIILLFIAGINFFFNNATTHLECTYEQGSQLSYDDACTIRQESISSSSAVMRAIIPQWLRHVERSYPLSLLQGADTVRRVETRTEEEDSIKYVVRLVFDENALERVLAVAEAAEAAEAAAGASASSASSASHSPALPPITLSSLRDSVFQGTTDVLEYDESSRKDALALARRLDAFVRAAHASAAAAGRSGEGRGRAEVLSHTRDNSLWDEVIIVVLLLLSGVLAYAPAVSQTVTADARTGTLHVVSYSLIGRVCANRVIPLTRVRCFDERVRVRQDDVNRQGRIVYWLVAKVRAARASEGRVAAGAGARAGGDAADLEETEIDIGLGETSNRVGLNVLRERLSGWLVAAKHRHAAVAAAAEGRHPAIAGGGVGAEAGAEAGAAEGNDADGGDNGERARLLPGSGGGSANASLSPGSGSGGASPSNARVCCVCMDESRAVRALFMPCRHLVCCQVCAAALDKCPLCRGSIDDVILAFT